MEDSTIGEGNKRKKRENYFSCPRCQTIITYEGKQDQKIKIGCPVCGKESIIDFVLKKPKKMLPLTKNKSNNKNLPSEKKPIQNYETLVKKTSSQFSEKLTLRKIIWILFEFFIIVTILSLLFIAATGDINIQTLFISIFIGILVTREIMDEFISYHQKKQINIIVSGLLITFLLIILNKIITIIST